MDSQKILQIFDYFMTTEKLYSTTLELTVHELITSSAFDEPQVSSFKPLIDIIFLYWQALIDTHEAFFAEVQDFYGEQMDPERAAERLAKCFTVHEIKGNFDSFLRYFENYPRALAILKHLQSTQPHVAERLQEAERSINTLMGDTFANLTLEVDILTAPILHVQKYPDILGQLADCCVLPDSRASCRRAQELMHDIAHSAQVIIDEDSQNLIFLEKLQNNIVNLPDYFGSGGWNQYMKTRQPRHNLRDNGKYRYSGEVKLRGGHLQHFKKLFLVLFDQMVLMLEPTGESNHHGKLYTFEKSYSDKELKAYSVTTSIFSKSGFMLYLGRSPDNPLQHDVRVNDQKAAEAWIKAGETIDKGIEHGSVKGHHVYPFQFLEPTRCKVCHRLLKGLHYQGYRCLSRAPQIEPRESTLKAKRNLVTQYFPGCHGSFHRDCVERSGQCPRNVAGAPQPPDPTPASANQGPGEPKWEAGEMPEDQAEELLMLCRDGGFMIRREMGITTHQLWLTVGFRYNEREASLTVKHIPIYVTEERELYIGTQNPATCPLFSGLSALVGHYMTNFGGVVPGYGGVIGAPYQMALRTETRSRGGLFFDWLEPSIKEEVLIQTGLISLLPLKR